MAFLHHKNIVKPFVPFFAPADIFQIAEAPALPVHIIWEMPRRRESRLRAGKHISGERSIPPLVADW